MSLKAFTGAVVIAALALTASAVAQNLSLRQQPVPAIPSAIANAGAPLAPRTGKLAVEPAAMEGMLAAQNGARQRIGLPPLTWSSELAAKAEASASSLATPTCSSSTVTRAATAEGAASYWTAGLNRLGGAPSIQTIIPSFLVSEWSAGRGDYDLARHTCRRSGPCDQYARMVSPNAHQVGCARAICPSQAQIWICRYDDSAPPPSPSATSTTR